MRFSPLILGLAALALWARPAVAQDDPNRDDPSAPAVLTPSSFPDAPTQDDPSAPAVRTPTDLPDGPTADDPSAPPYTPAPARPTPTGPSARDVLPARTSAVTPATGPRRSARDALPARTTAVTPATGPRRPAREVLAEHADRRDAMRAEIDARRHAAPSATEEAATVAAATPAAAVAVSDVLTVDGPWPNPVRDRARLTVTSPTDGRARVAVFDVRGREVVVAFDDAVVAGQPVSITLDAGRLATGTYLVVLDAAGTRESRTIQVVR